MKFHIKDKPKTSLALSRRFAALVFAATLMLVGCDDPPPTTTAPQPPSPAPSKQPLAGPPFADAKLARDVLLKAASEGTTTDTATGYGVHARWRAIFPQLRFVGGDRPAVSDSVSGGDEAKFELGSDITRTVTFAVIDTAGVCAGGYMTGVDRPTKFEAVDPPTECSGNAVYSVRNPEPKPSPTRAALPRCKFIPGSDAVSNAPCQLPPCPKGFPPGDTCGGVVTGRRR